MPVPKSPGRPPNRRPFPPTSTPAASPPPAPPPRGAAQVPPAVAEPAENPLRQPPAPELPRRAPGRPRKGEGPKPSTPPEAATKAKRELPRDPDELNRALAGPRAEATGLVDVVDQLCGVLPPRLPLLAPERAGLTESIARVLYVYDLLFDPAWLLLFSALAIAAPRYVLYRRGVVDVGDKGRAAAAAVSAPPPAAPEAAA